MDIVFMGTPDFAVPILEALHKREYKIKAVFTQPDRPSGRGRVLAPPPVKVKAVELGLPVRQPLSLRNEAEIEEMRKLSPQAIIVAAYGLLLPPAILEIPPLGCINIHPSLLPRHRGPSPVSSAILNGDIITGVSIMLMDKRMDTGPILAQRQMPVLPEDNTGFLTGKLSRLGASLLLEVLPLWADKRIEPQIQDNSIASYSQLLKKEEGEIQWNSTAEFIWLKIRAFNPWPGCYTFWQGKRLRITEAYPVNQKSDHPPGKVIILNNSRSSVGITTIDRVLGLLQVQLEGKKPMLADAFIRGQQQFINAQL